MIICHMCGIPTLEGTRHKEIKECFGAMRSTIVSLSERIERLNVANLERFISIGKAV